ncbi:hypothetical protein F5Y17DRAFT_411363 [Xylariaceae sp. FL0594]|nr:hypothetical protein F5Y17DRAFT_411363 [Xylariaceae sp. FL0594]
MSRRGHHRSRSSVDRVLELLSELDEEQMQILLREAESTVSGNIPVAKGIDYFSRQATSPTLLSAPPQPAPRKKFLTSLSPRKQTDLRRRQSKRASVHIQKQDSAAALSDGGGGGGGGSEAPSRSAGNGGHSNKKTPRSYKRISRPVFSLPMPAATANLTELLAAYLTADTDALSLPTSALSPTSPTCPSPYSSPATPRSPLFSSQPLFHDQSEWEDEDPVLDLLEPSPSRAPRKAKSFGTLLSGDGAGSIMVKQPVRKISGIFEVLDDASSVGFHH